MCGVAGHGPPVLEIFAMMRAIQSSKHRPMHMELDGAWYFLTARTLEGKDVFAGDERMGMLQSVFVHAQELYDVKVFGYILWPNHYHIILQLDEQILADFVRNVHSNSARILNQLDNAPGRRVWYQYWDRFLRIQYSLDDLYRRMSYIMHNPVKHGWCDTFDEAVTYSWSSMPKWVTMIGKDGLFECWTKYPVKDFSEYNA